MSKRRSEVLPKRKAGQAIKFVWAIRSYLWMRKSIDGIKLKMECHLLFLKMIQKLKNNTKLMKNNDNDKCKINEQDYGLNKEDKNCYGI